MAVEGVGVIARMKKCREMDITLERFGAVLMQNGKCKMKMEYIDALGQRGRHGNRKWRLAWREGRSNSFVREGRKRNEGVE